MIQGGSTPLSRYARIALWLVLGLAFVGLAYQTFAAFRTPTVEIKWSTGSEVGTAGFNLYRAEDPQGQTEKINDALIPGAPDPLRGADYSYTDENVVAGATYYYLVEEIETDGSVNQHGPIVVTAQSGGWLQVLALAVLAGAVLVVLFPGALGRGGQSKQSTEAETD
ncbi:MAG: hypothetical protein R3335_00060 [Anaerolineales bacterium]|nr:hypothetical protein [Anaerolineales bacterium]